MTYRFSFLLALICAVAGYLLGNLQSAVIVSKLQYRQDIRHYGSHNAGTTNMLRVYGTSPGTLTFIGDLLKMVASVLIGRALMGTLGGYIAGACTVIGHCYPVFAEFKGGKGAASLLAFTWMVYPLAGLCVTVTAAVAFLIWKRVSLSSLLGGLVFVILVLIFRWNNTALVIFAVLLYSFMVFRHKDNIRRLIRGEEPKLVIKGVKM
ncbi:MAG: glycerol-3-phosphate 1-O-acyltransferase PlsY [Clostridiales bacterium]|nr:glycerol-3-phosphate 1-O-acyltransferase PlsY [Clostridiales bacterium]